MDRSEIVQKFLAAGYQLGSDALSYFEENQDKVQTFLDLSSGKPETPIITKQIIDNILGGINPKIKIAKTFFSKNKPVMIEELANQLRNRYQKISEIMSKKPELANLISVNRISQQTKKFSLIAMIKEINLGDRSLVVEDPTGTAPVYISDEAVADFNYLVEDEVIGLVCDNEDSSENRVVKIIFPDIPLATKISASSEEIFVMFLSDIHIDELGFLPHSLEKLSNYLKKIKQETIVFVLGDIAPDKEKVEKFVELFPKNFSLSFLKGELENYLPDPVVVEINGVEIFLSHGDIFSKYFEKFKTSPEIMLLELIKKRHLSPNFKQNKNFDEEKLFLDKIPDIFVIGHYHDPRILNYKGVTIVSLGSFLTKPIFWSVNLKTRESIKIDLT